MGDRKQLEGHEDGKCGAVFKGKPPCKHPAGYGTNHPGIGPCKHHGGCTPAHEQAASKEIAKRECDRLGVAIDTTPADALLNEVREAAGNVSFYRELVQDLNEHPSDAGEPALYHPTHHASGEPTGEAKPHVLVVLYNEERARLREAAKAALHARIEERVVRMAEADAERIAEAQMRALIDMGLTDRLEEFRERFNDRLAGEQPAHLGAAPGRA